MTTETKPDRPVSCFRCSTIWETLKVVVQVVLPCWLFLIH